MTLTEDLQKFKEYWEKAIKPDLQNIKIDYQKNIPTTGKYFALAFISVILTLIFSFIIIFTITDEEEIIKNAGIVWAIGMTGMVTGVMKIFAASEKRKQFMKGFKQKIIEPCIQFIDPDLNYEAENHISYEDLSDSSLFNSFSLQSGDDKISGEMLGNAFFFSEVFLSYTTKSSGTRKSQRHIQSFIVFEIQRKDIAIGELIIYPKMRSRSKLIYHNRPPKGFTYMENNPFAESYTVMWKESEDAKSFLSSSLIAKMDAIQEKLKNNLFLSTHDNKIYLALPREYGNIVSSFLDFDEKGNTITHFRTYEKIYNNLTTFRDIVRIMVVPL